ncbi:MAG: flippase-like domain-containing protein [Deltaproteobacteria bacterium]|jgi:glycosyltransferase 2 family protein|nr:flippase-like domain-containing protein [Deltaproteobacteria bacterium]
MKRKAITTLGWLISAILIATLFAKLDLRTIWHGLTSAKWNYLIAASILNLGVVVIKAVRWQWLMSPQKRTHFWNIFKATMIGMAGNNVLPARGGDLLKIYLLCKWEKVSKTVLASIIGLDKLFEGLTILILFGIMSMHSTFPEWVQKGTLIISILMTVMLAISILLLIHHRKTVSQLEDELGKFSRIAKKLGSGLSALANYRIGIATLFLSVIICAIQIVVIWLCQEAFGQHLDLWVPALVYVAINLAIIVPSAPSGIGPFETAAVLAYSWLGITAEMGFDIAIMYHLIQLIPITIIGFIMYIRSTKRTKLSKIEKVEGMLMEGE